MEIVDDVCGLDHVDVALEYELGVLGSPMDLDGDRPAHELTAKVIRVDDFAQDLGASEMRTGSAAAPAPTSPSVVHKAAA